MLDLGVLPGHIQSAGYGINDNGQVTGVSARNPFTDFRAFRYTDGVGMLDLGVLLSGDYSEGFGINDAGDVVGNWKTSIGSPDNGVFLYTDTFGMVDLNTLLPPNSGWVLTGANDINNRGQITGFGIFDGQSRAYLLTPIPEPGSAALLATALVALTGLAHHKRRQP